MIDSPFDPDAASPGDGPVDARFVDAALGCPAMYQPLPNSGPRGHRYLQTPAPGGWLEMRDFCQSIGGFLAFPDGSTAANAQLELTALITLAGNGTWIGVTDLGTEGTFRNAFDQNVSAATATFLQGGNSQQSDCAAAQTDKFNIEDCANNHKAVCECVP